MNDTHDGRTSRIVAVGLALVLVASALAFAPAAAAQNDATTVEVTASDLPDGLAGASFTVSVDDSSSTITDVTVADQFALNRTSIASDGSSATIKLVDLNEQVNANASDVTLATVTVEGDASLSISADRIDDDTGDSVDVSALSVGGSAAVTGTDVDGDGLFEDLDGDGEFTFVDVIEFVFAVQDGNLDGYAPAGGLDFNGDDTVDFVDVIELVFALQG